MRMSFWLVLAMLWSVQIASAQVLGEEPNLLLIMVDDMGYGDVQLAGNPDIRTPHLDALARQSVQFENFYVSSVCAPTRASLLTGRYHQRTGVQSVTNGWEVMHADEETLAEVLADQGYRTGIFGKWHLGEYYPNLPNEQGFDTYIGFRTGHTADYYDAVLEKNAKPYQTDGYITDALTDEAWSFMSQAGDDPFFCYLPYNAPHTPLLVDSSWFVKYAQMGYDERTARIYGMVENLDYNIGRLLDSLASMQLLDNTMVIFLSDNGPINGWRVPQEEMRFNAGLRDQKFTVYEGGIRTQCYWMWKNHWSPGYLKNQVGAHIDVLPTVLDILEIRPPGVQLDGISLRNALETFNEPNPDRFFFQKYQLGTFGGREPQPGGMARRGNWKMVDGSELYDLDQDPGETQNLALQYPDTLKFLNQAYGDWWQSILESNELTRPPVMVGFNETDTVFLQPHHGTATGHLQFTGHRGLLGEREGTHPSGVDGDWLAAWQPGDRISWQIEVQEPGSYTVGMKMSTSGSSRLMVRLLFNDETVQFAFDSGEVRDGWQYVTLPSVKLNAGQEEVILELVEDRGESDFALRSLGFQKTD